MKPTFNTARGRERQDVRAERQKSQGKYYFG